MSESLLNKITQFMLIGVFFIFAGCSLFQDAGPLDDTIVYRGLDANSKTMKAKLSPSQFRFNPDLSTTTDEAILEKPCTFTFTVDDEGNVVGLPGYTAKHTSTDQDPNHWSIYHPENVDADAAKKAVSDYAKEHLTSLNPATCQ
ncbi:hypothetical protein [uncultured Ruegeria sp.]|uniref:hypothetical protein n=1 Tax=uncultured Ruegeria sp. TaxID=259304 RepID=UPI00261C1CCC|nr:hypothetical protein [uncultured Ruegeria sp.]